MCVVLVAIIKKTYFFGLFSFIFLFNVESLQVKKQKWFLIKIPSQAFMFFILGGFFILRTTAKHSQDKIQKKLDSGSRSESRSRIMFYYTLHDVSFLRLKNIQKKFFYCRFKKLKMEISEISSHYRVYCRRYLSLWM